jgi:hypothetical protein
MRELDQQTSLWQMNQERLPTWSSIAQPICMFVEEGGSFYLVFEQTGMNLSAALIWVDLARS